LIFKKGCDKIQVSWGCCHASGHQGGRKLVGQKQPPENIWNGQELGDKEEKIEEKKSDLLLKRKGKKKKD